MLRKVPTLYKSLLRQIAQPTLALPRIIKRTIVVLIDVSLCLLTVWIAFYLRLDEFIPLTGHGRWAAIGAVAIAIPVFTAFGLYRAIFRYSGLPALFAITRAVAVYGLIYASLFTAVGFSNTPRTVGLLQPILLLLLVVLSRTLARLWLGDEYQQGLKLANLPKVLIYGAGKSGRQLAAAMANSTEMRVVGFLDDDPRLHKQVLNGLTIYNPQNLPHLLGPLQANVVLLALPSVNRTRRNEIIAGMLPLKVAIRTLPSVIDLAQGKVGVSDIRELDIDDLLGRDPIPPNLSLLAKNCHNKVVLITGAGGSIGSELCRQIQQLNPRQLLLIEQSEFALYNIHQELIAKESKTDIVPLLASVQDEARMRHIIAAWRPDTLYHAAAYKHVPLVEHNLAEGVKNNVRGTLVPALLALEYGVRDFVLISTDKAVRPTNLMGASKRLAEIILQALAAETPNTSFVMVRFGNVLGSSGSVVPLFRQQIHNGGPITLTHPDITRYFMTIPEAAQLVIQAGAMAQGGDVFVLDMGAPVKIIDLARRMVELSGLKVRDHNNPLGDIEIAISGLRPGEKLYEELLIGNNPQDTPHPRIMKATEDFMPWHSLKPQLEALLANCNNSADLKNRVAELVPGYTPEDGIVDWVYVQQAGNR